MLYMSIFNRYGRAHWCSGKKNPNRSGLGFKIMERRESNLGLFLVYQSFIVHLC